MRLRLTSPVLGVAVAAAVGLAGPAPSVGAAGTAGTHRTTSVSGSAAPGLRTAPSSPSRLFGRYPGTAPRQCSVLVAGVRPDTALVGFRYEKGRVHSEMAGRIGWVPRTMTTVTDLSAAATVFWAIREDGGLYRITVSGGAGGVRVAADRVATGWGGIRVLAAGSPTGDTGVTYLYGLTTNGGLKRYVTSADGRQLRSAHTIATHGWAEVRTLSFDRVRLTGPGARPREADVMLATTGSGRLAEFSFPRTTHLLWTRTVLRTSTWQVFAAVNSGYCDSDQPSRAIVAVKPDGAAYLYVDQNGNDGWGGDIGRGLKVATWSGATLYNQ